MNESKSECRKVSKVMWLTTVELSEYISDQKTIEEITNQPTKEE